MRKLRFSGISAIVVLVLQASAFAAVDTNQIVDGAVTTAKIADGAVAAEKIADSAVTDAKISGPISASKISPVDLDADTVDGKHAVDLAPAVHSHSPSEVTGLEAALAGKAEMLHNHDTLYQQKYGKTAVVAKTGGDYTDPVAAMNDLAAWCGTPASDNPCLLKIMPGVYDLGATTLQMQGHVDIEGSGTNTTVLQGSPADAVVRGASSAELRNLKIEHTTGYGIYNAGVSPSISNVSIVTDGSNAVTATAIYNVDASPVFNDITIRCFGYAQNYNYEFAAVANRRGSPSFNNIKIDYTTASGSGIAFYSSESAALSINNLVLNSNSNTSATQFQTESPTLSNSVISSTGPAVWIAYNVNMKISNCTLNAANPGGSAIGSQGNPTSIARVVNTEINGQLTTNLKCMNNYDKDMVPVACP